MNIVDHKKSPWEKNLTLGGIYNWLYEPKRWEKWRHTTLNINNSTQSGPILMQSFSEGEQEPNRPEKIHFGKTNLI